MLKTKQVSEIMNMPVYTDSGDYFGEVEESLITSNKIYGWKVRSTKRSYLSRALMGAKGVIVPHQLVRSIGDIMIITRTDLPSEQEDNQVQPMG